LDVEGAGVFRWRVCSTLVEGDKGLVGGGSSATRAVGARRGARRRRGCWWPLQGRTASKLYVIQLGYAPYRRRYWVRGYSAWRWPESSLSVPGRGRRLGFL